MLDISRGDGGTLFVQGGGSRDPKDPPAAAADRRSPSSTTAASGRTLEKKIPVTLQMNVDNKFFDADLNAFNIVARDSRAPTRPTRS